jgi:hypothetical protein
VAASATTLTEIFGIGPIVAAMLIGYTGDPTRFTTAARFASYIATASTSTTALPPTPAARQRRPARPPTGERPPPRTNHLRPAPPAAHHRGPGCGRSRSPGSRRMPVSPTAACGVGWLGLMSRMAGVLS